MENGKELMLVPEKAPLREQAYLTPIREDFLISKEALINHFMNLKMSQELTHQFQKEISKFLVKLEQDVEEIKENTKPRIRKNKQGVPLPLRKPATNGVLKILLNRPKQKRERELCHSRFRLAVVLLWASGCRVNEIRLLTRKDVEMIRREGVFILYQEKTRKFRRLNFSRTALNLLDSMKRDIDTVYRDHEFLGGLLSNLNWIRFINTKLAKNLKDRELNIKSHSFRINMVTQSLKEGTLEKVSQLIGHKDIRTTLIYDRYKMCDKEALELLDKIQDLENPEFD